VKKIVGSVILASTLLSGCAVQTSYPVTYHQEDFPVEQSKNLATVGITKWQDNRNIASIKDNYSETAVMRMGPATVGITDDDKEFVRVADYVRKNFIEELRSLGVNTKSIDLIPKSDDHELLTNLAKNNDVSYLISGQLLNFDVNCHGAWTLECSRNVSFSMSMIDSLGDELITREIYSAAFSNNEGMGVMHSTLLDQLTNQVLREALEKAVRKTIKELNSAI